MTTMVRNAWYVAAWASEVDDALRRFVILGDPVLLYRRSDGTAVAMEDRCPHRLLPLSKGKRIGDSVQCGYHGLVFGPDGKCTRVPGQDNVPKSAYVERYPIVERNGMIWIWMGEADHADESQIFDLPQLSDPAWISHSGPPLKLECNYLNVAENLVDPAHVSFVHPTTLGNAASENVPVHVSTQGNEISAWRWIRNAEPIGLFKNLGLPSDTVDRWHYYRLYLPSIAVIDFGVADPADAVGDDNLDDGVRMFTLHFITPVDENHTIDRWMHLRANETESHEISQKIEDMLQTAFIEDKDVLEAIHKQEQLPAKRRPIRIAIDRAPMVYRKRIGEMLERERTVDASAPPNQSFVFHN